MTEPTNAAWRALVAKHVEEFRSSHGTVGGRLRGSRVLLLTTTGARTGRPRMVALIYFTVDGHMIVVGSKGGAAKDPGWVHNLRAHPRAHVEVDTADYDVAARELPASERHCAFREVVLQEPRFAEYQDKTERVIPLFELRRVDTAKTRC